MFDHIAFTRNENGTISLTTGRKRCARCGRDLGPSGTDTDFFYICDWCKQSAGNWLTNGLPLTKSLPEFGGQVYGV